jgi:hypothetical protein
MPRKALAGPADEHVASEHLQIRQASLGFTTSHAVIRNGPPRSTESQNISAPPMRRIVLALEGSSGEGAKSSVVRGPLTGMARARECVLRRRRRARPRRDQCRHGVNTTKTAAKVPNAAHGLTCYLHLDNMLSRTRHCFQSDAEEGAECQSGGRRSAPACTG